jgi:hypothetical protein
MNRAATSALIAFACLVAPTAASASVASAAANRHADHAALSAYQTYLQALVAGKPSGVESEQLFASDTSTTCYKALAPIATSATVPDGTSAALTDIGNEIGADAGLQFLTVASDPMTQLALTLSTLHWGGPGPASTVRRFLAADEALMSVEPSNLCGDALSVASEAGAQQVTTPPATLTFLASYQADTTLANTRLKMFVKMLDNWTTVADRGVAEKIDLLAIKVNTVSTAAITAGTKSLFRALGIPVSESASVSKDGL